MAPPHDDARQPIRSQYSWYLLVCTLLMALGVRIAAFNDPAAQAGTQRPVVDAAWHDWWARGVAFGIWDPPNGEPDPEIASHAYFKPPGYPWFLGVVYRVAKGLPGGGAGSDRGVAVHLVQAGLGLGTILLAFLLGRLFSGPRAGLASAALLAGCPLPAWYEGELLEPALSSFLGLSLAGAVWLAAERDSHPVGLGAGILLGAAALVRPNTLLWIPFVMVWWTSHRSSPDPVAGGDDPSISRRRLAVRVGWFLLGAALIVAPVTIRNWSIEGEPVIISANAGLNLALGNHERADGASPVGPGFQRWSSFEYPRRVRGKWPGETVGYAEASRRFRNEALAWAVEHPRDFLRLLGRKFLLLIGPKEVENAGNRVEEFELSQSPVLSRLPVGFPVLLILALAAVFLPRHPKASSCHTRFWSGPEALIGGMAVVWLLTFLPFFAAARYRAPVLPLLGVLAGMGFERLRTLSRRDLGRAVVVLVGAGVLAIPNWAGFTPNLAGGWFLRGVDLATAGDPSGARAAYLQALRINPRHSWARNNLGSLQLQSGEEEEALAQFQEAARNGEECPEGLYNFGVLSGRRNAWQDAYSALSEYVRFVPECSGGWYNLALAATGLERLEEAEKAYRQALSLAPREVESRNNLAVILALRGRFAESWKEIEACRDLGFEPDPGLVEAVRSHLE